MEQKRLIVADDDYLPPLRLEKCPLIVPLTTETVKGQNNLTDDSDDYLAPLRLEQCPLTVPVEDKDDDIKSNLQDVYQSLLKSSMFLPLQEMNKAALTDPIQAGSKIPPPKLVKPPYTFKLKKDILGRVRLCSNHSVQKPKSRETMREKIVRALQTELKSRRSELSKKKLALPDHLNGAPHLYEGLKSTCDYYDVYKKNMNGRDFKALLEDASGVCRSHESIEAFKNLDAKHQDLELSFQNLESISQFYKSDLSQILRETGKCLPPHQLAFFASQLINAESEEKIWPIEVRRILVGLYSISPQAYRLLSPKLCFPVENEVKRWTLEFNLDRRLPHSLSDRDTLEIESARNNAIPETVVDELAFENFMSTLI